MVIGIVGIRLAQLEARAVLQNGVVHQVGRHERTRIPLLQRHLATHPATRRHPVVRRLRAHRMVGVHEALDAHAQRIVVLRADGNGHRQQQCIQQQPSHKPFSSLATVNSALSTFTSYCVFFTTMVVLCSVWTFLISIFSTVQKP